MIANDIVMNYHFRKKISVNILSHRAKTKNEKVKYEKM